MTIKLDLKMTGGVTGSVSTAAAVGLVYVLTNTNRRKCVPVDSEVE